jgi:hypothetical protein
MAPGSHQTASLLWGRLDASPGPMDRFWKEQVGALLASAEGDFDVARSCLQRLAVLARDLAIRHGEQACLIGFAKLALDRGDYPRASYLLASVRASAAKSVHTPFRTHLEAEIYLKSTAVLRGVLDADSAGTTRTEGAAVPIEVALDRELADTTSW